MKEARPANTRSLLLSALILGSSAFQALAYYHPDEGRWLSRDPIGETGGKCLYVFVKNDPMNHCDALGLLALDGQCSLICYSRSVFSVCSLDCTFWTDGLCERECPSKYEAPWERLHVAHHSPAKP